jgi:pyruvate oxidase
LAGCEQVIKFYEVDTIEKQHGVGMSDDKPKIKVQKNGPFTVVGLAKFTNSRNEPIEPKKVMALCRCGASRKKPFCDGAHVGIGFSGEKNESRVPDKLDNYVGQKITIHDNRGVCSHAGFCTGNLPQVFHGGVEPWIDADAATTEEIKRVIDMCPSGALSYSENEVEHKDRDNEPEIHISRNGPYHVRGGVRLDEHDLGDGVSTEHYTLCRCGHSGNKPRCDGSHWYAAFKDDEAQTISAANRAAEQKEPEWVKVAELDELKDGETKPLRLQNLQIVMSRIGDQYGAIDGVCPHQGGPLMDGTIDEGVLRCPWHGHAFDPITGKSYGDDPDVNAFEVESRDDGIYLKVEAPSRSAWTVSHVMVETMVNWGVRHVFGMVGHSNLGVAEAIRVQEKKGKLTYIGIRHEGAAAFACSGYAKACDTPAACLTIAGPGATNLMTGLWDAKMDRVPVLALTGQINTQFVGPGAFQEIDLKGAFTSVADFSKVVLPGSDHPELMSLALKSAIVNRNVAHLIFPDEVQVQDAGDKAPSYPDGRLTDTDITPSDSSINEAIYRIARAKRPAIIIGHGARNALDEVLALAEKLNAPILTTYKAKGYVSDYHPLGCGVLGRSGTPVSAWFMNNADLLLVFGASFSQHTGIDQTKPLIQVDHERVAIGRFHAIDTPIWGDTAIAARLMSERLPERFECIDCRDEIADRRVKWREEKAARAKIKGDCGLNSAYIIEVMEKLCPKNAIFSLDVGNNTYSFGRYFDCTDHRVILCGYLGSIGFAFPAAMGAYMAQCERPVISVSGDGGFGQYMGEFNTAVKYNMDITHVLFNNGELGKISKEQRDGKWPVWQTELSNPNFAEYARACGGRGFRVEQDAELEDALRQALAHKGPSLVDILCDPDLT